MASIKQSAETAGPHHKVVIHFHRAAAIFAPIADTSNARGLPDLLNALTRMSVFHRVDDQYCQFTVTQPEAAMRASALLTRSLYRHLETKIL